jgi:zona occludens toxin (predicted ATPase)
MALGGQTGDGNADPALDAKTMIRQSVVSSTVIATVAFCLVALSYHDRGVTLVGAPFRLLYPTRRVVQFRLRRDTDLPRSTGFGIRFDGKRAQRLRQCPTKRRCYSNLQQQLRQLAVRQPHVQRHCCCSGAVDDAARRRGGRGVGLRTPSPGPKRVFDRRRLESVNSVS